MTNPTTLFCFVTLAVVACAAKAPVRVAPVLPKASVSAVTPVPLKPSVSAVTPDAAPPEPPPSARPRSSAVVRSSPKMTGAEMLALLQDACQVISLSSLPDGPATGCACCAPFDDCRPGSRAVASKSVFQPTLAIAGSFTRAGADEWAMPMRGCEPPVDNYGGLVVLERRGSAYVLERYVSGINPAKCWAVRRDDGRDLLVCRRDDAHQGTGSSLLFQWDLAEPDAALLAADPLVYVSDDAISGCWTKAGTPVSSIEMGEPRFSEEAGRPLLSVPLDVREGAVTAAYLARCQSNERASSRRRKQSAPRLLLPAAPEELRFGFDGAKFVQKSGPRRQL